MEIYVDKLPENCGLTECEFSKYVNSAKFYCGILNMDLNTRTQRVTRNSLCPLKELTNAQLAVGWYQEGKRIYNRHKAILRNDFTISTLINQTWKVEEVHNYTFTDWKGAREAAKADKRATNNNVTLHNKNGNYTIVDEEGFIQIMTDELYDSKEWKVWE